jgi:hypothetical protein
MRILALDQSKARTGWACWSPDDQQVSFGHWILGSELTPAAAVFCKIHRCISDLNSLGRIDALFYEQPINSPTDNNTQTLLMFGLASHIESWGHAMHCRIIEGVHQKSWRRHFLGAQPFKQNAMSKAQKQLHDIGAVAWKDLAMERCRQIGFKPRFHDEAEAIGILDYACMRLGIQKNWGGNEQLFSPT